jgi:hypothetical protein
MFAAHRVERHSGVTASCVASLVFAHALAVLGFGSVSIIAIIAIMAKLAFIHGCNSMFRITTAFSAPL